MTTSLRMTPKVPDRFGTSVVGSLIVTEADVVDGLQLAKISDKDNRHIAKMEILWSATKFCDITSFSLLQSAMHAVEKGSTYERHLVDDQEYYVVPLLLKIAKLITFQLFLELGIWENVESGTCCFGTEANVESSHASVGSQLHSRFNILFLKEKPQVL